MAIVQECLGILLVAAICCCWRWLHKHIRALPLHVCRQGGGETPGVTGGGEVGVAHHRHLHLLHLHVLKLLMFSIATISICPVPQVPRISFRFPVPPVFCSLSLWCLSIAPVSFFYLCSHLCSFLALQTHGLHVFPVSKICVVLCVARRG
jgi:hypothetical protein